MQPFNGNFIVCFWCDVPLFFAVYGIYVAERYAEKYESCVLVDDCSIFLEGLSMLGFLSDCLFCIADCCVNMDV